MAKIYRYFFGLLVCFLIGQAANATNYYVANAGSNGNSGTDPLHPFQTVAYAVSQASANDTINLNGGDTFTENVTPTVHLAFQSYGTGQGIMDGTSTAPISCTNVGVTVNNLNLEVSALNANVRANSCVSILLNDTSTHNDGYSVTNCTMSGGFAGVYAHATVTTTQLNNITITNNDMSNMGNGGIIFDSDPVAFGTPVAGANFSNVYIGYNKIHDSTCASFVTNGPHGIAIGGLNPSIGNNLIEYNETYNMSTGTGSTTSSGAYFPRGCTQCTWQYNAAYNYRSTITTSVNNFDGFLYDLDLTNSNVVFQYNYGYSTGGMLFEFLSNTGGLTGNVLRWNVFVDGKHSQYITTGGPGCVSIVGGDALQIYGNTFCSSDATATEMLYIASGCSQNKKIYNNVFITNAGEPAIDIVDPSLGTGFACDYNYYQSGGGAFSATHVSTNRTSLAAWQSALGIDTHSVAASYEPLVCPIEIPITPAPGAFSKLQQYFAPLTGSVIANAGVDLSTISGITPGTIDIAGNTLVAPYSIGALANPASPLCAYDAAVFADNPVAWYRLADQQNFTDSCFQFIGASYTGSNVTLQQPSIIPNTGLPCVAMVPSSSVINSPDGTNVLPITFTSGMTLEYWMKQTSSTATVPFFMGANNSATATTFLGAIRERTSEITTGSVSHWLTDTSSNHDYWHTNAAAFTVGQPIHIMWTWTAGTAALTCYVNGVSVGTTGDSGNTNALSTIGLIDFGLGSLVFNTGWQPSTWGGNIQNVILYNTALSAGRAAAHYAAGIMSSGGSSSVNVGFGTIGIGKGSTGPGGVGPTGIGGN